jgi:hypothetical protein
VLGSFGVITKTTVKALIAGGGVLATWLAVGPNHSAPVSVAPQAERSIATHETTAEEFNAQAKKLREHGGGAQLRPSTRNPFRFGTSRRNGPNSGSAMHAPATIAPAEAAAPPTPNFTLAGIAERNTPEGRKRTAVITGAGQLYLVTEGEMVGGRYVVVRVDPEAVLLRDQTGAELNLVLR